MGKRGGKFFSDALDSHWRKYQKRLKTCRRDVSEDNVHELRISTRRLLALIELIRTLQPHSSLNKLRKELKHLLDGFDDLRDTQVMSLEIAGSLPEFPELAPFMSYLQQRERQLLLEIGPHIANQKQGELRRKIRKTCRRVRAQTAKNANDAPILHAIDNVYATALERYRAIDATELTSIHHLRIPVKKLRYMLTAVESIIPDLPENHLRRLQTYLTRMGDIQNSAVLSLSLEAFFVDGVPEGVIRYYRKQQQGLLEQFIEHRGEIFSFWRSTPDQALPWRSQYSASGDKDHETS